MYASIRSMTLLGNNVPNSINVTRIMIMACDKVVSFVVGGMTSVGRLVEGAE